MNQAVAQSSPQIIAIEHIHVQNDFNPRKNFDEVAFNRLVSSIRENGLISPICVRRVADDQYHLVAGERRFRAMSLLKEMEIPALVIECDDQEARQLSLIENLDRADLSVAEEALFSQKHVDAYQGDYAKAAESLGWTVSKLKHRLQLLHCTESVMNALMTNQILLGHAELISTLPSESQDALLPRVIESKATVATLKEQLEGFSISLTQRIFDDTDCKTCPHNSELQAELFSSSISSGRCTNKTCFTDKTKQKLVELKDQHKDDYAVIAYQTEKVEGTTVPLVASGANGVGVQQFKSCQGCAFFGGILEDRLGNSTGQITAPMCFQRTCNSEKIASYQKSIEVVVVAEPANENPIATKADTTGVTKPKAPSNEAPVSASKTPAGVAVQYDRSIRAAVNAHVSKDLKWSLAFAVYGQASLIQGVRNCPYDNLQKVLKLVGLTIDSGYNKTRHIEALATQDEAVLRQALIKLPIVFLSQDASNQADYVPIPRREMNIRVVATDKVDVSPYVVIDEPFLNAHTKAGIQEIMESSGFKDWLVNQTDGEKNYQAMLAMKKDECIKKLLALNYDFSGYVPTGINELVAYTLKNAKK